MVRPLLQQREGCRRTPPRYGHRHGYAVAEDHCGIPKVLRGFDGATDLRSPQRSHVPDVIVLRPLGKACVRGRRQEHSQRPDGRTVAYCQRVEGTMDTARMELVLQRRFQRRELRMKSAIAPPEKLSFISGLLPGWADGQHDPIGNFSFNTNAKRHRFSLDDLLIPRINDKTEGRRGSERLVVMQKPVCRAEERCREENEEQDSRRCGDGEEGPHAPGTTEGDGRAEIHAVDRPAEILQRRIKKVP